MRWESGDLFEPPKPQPPQPKRKLPGQRPLSRNTVEARPASDRDRNIDAIILNEVKANWRFGRTRNEIHERHPKISIPTICWAFGRLLKSGKIFRRQVNPSGDGKLRFVSRDRCYVVYADLYRDEMRATEAPPYEERQ